jgi:phage baseplate assembly protein W
LDRVYGRDCALRGKQLSDNGAGDFAILSGVDNLSQQLQHRIDTPKGQARRHPDYGCSVHRLLGRVTGPTAAKLGASYVKAALKSDYRVKDADRVTAEVSGDSVRVVARALAIDGSSVDVVTQQ